MNNTNDYDYEDFKEIVSTIKDYGFEEYFERNEEINRILDIISANCPDLDEIINEYREDKSQIVENELIEQLLKHYERNNIFGINAEDDEQKDSEQADMYCIKDIAQEEDKPLKNKIEHLDVNGVWKQVKEKLIRTVPDEEEPNKKKPLPREKRYKIVDELFKEGSDVYNFYLDINESMCDTDIRFAEKSKKEKWRFYSRVFSPIDRAADYISVGGNKDNIDHEYDCNKSSSGKRIKLYNNEGLRQKYQDRNHSREYNTVNFSDLKSDDNDISELEFITSLTVDDVKSNGKKKKEKRTYYDSSGNILSKAEVKERTKQGKLTSYTTSTANDNEMKRIPSSAKPDNTFEGIEKCEFLDKINALDELDKNIVLLVNDNVEKCKIAEKSGLSVNQLQTRLHKIGKEISFEKYNDILPKTKICNRCKEEKRISEFHKDSSNLDGFHIYCKECRNKTK